MTKGSPRIGFSTLKVNVVGLANGKVMVQDTMGNHHEVNDLRSYGELPPLSGQQWLMERPSGGTWRLTKMLDPPIKSIPDVEGNLPSLGALQSVLGALTQLGHVNDKTEVSVPVIDGNRFADDLPQKLLAALAELGLVDDQTTSPD